MATVPATDTVRLPLPKESTPQAQIAHTVHGSLYGADEQRSFEVDNANWVEAQRLADRRRTAGLP